MGQAYMDNPASAFDLPPDFPLLIDNIRIISGDALRAELARVRRRLLAVERAVAGLQAYSDVFNIRGLSLTRVSSAANRQRRSPHTSVTLRWKVREQQPGVKSQYQKRAYCEFDDPMVQGFFANKPQELFEHFQDVEYRREYLNLHLRVWWSIHDVARQTALERGFDHVGVCHKNPLAILDTDGVAD